MADGDPVLTQQLAWMSIYDFNYRILALKKRADAIRHPSAPSGSFGLGGNGP